MSRLLCCLCARHADMGAALSHPQEGEVCDGAVLPAAPPTMADVIRSRKKKGGGGAGLGSLRRRLAAAARRGRARAAAGCEHARYIRAAVGPWRPADVVLLCERLEAAAALRDLVTQAELAREPAPALPMDLLAVARRRWRADIELVGKGFVAPAHRAILAARSSYFRDLLQRYPPSAVRIPLEGCAASLRRAELEGALGVVYAGRAAPARACLLCGEYERPSADGDLDIINVEGANTCRCGVPLVQSQSALRACALLGVQPDALHRDMRYLLDSREWCDARLVFRLEGGGAHYGFRSALELPCHRVVLAARSRFFRNVMSRRWGGGACGGAGGGAGSGAGGGAVCVDEAVLPRRFARALLHAAYTDQVDLSLIGRNSSSPSSTNSTGSGSSARAGGGRARGGGAALEDAFQLYEIARFLEMPIVVQGCEDAIAEALSPETLPCVVRWAAAPHASAWLRRQAARYLRDEFVAVMASAASARLPRDALIQALQSPFLQASEAQALRAAVRWARRDAGADALPALLPHLRLELLPPDHELLAQLVRRGVAPPPAPRPAAPAAAAAWLARPPRCFLPYLDELKALLEEQTVPETDVMRARSHYAQRIPDTLYMVAAARGGGCGGAEPRGSAGGGAEGEAAAACVSPRVLSALRARVRELRAAAPAARALRLPAIDAHEVYLQIALRAVRERSLPDACADLLLRDIDTISGDRSRSSGEWQYERAERVERVERAERCERAERAEWAADTDTDDCCSAGSLRAGGGRTAASQRADVLEGSTSRAARREPPSRADSLRRAGGVSGAGGVGGAGGRLSAAVPDVAMAPNANTHLLTAPHYFRAPPHLHLDLGDGATHTPRPGSRAARAVSQQRGPTLPQGTRRDAEELRAAIELSVMRAYSSLSASGGGVGGAAVGASGGVGGARPPSATLPHPRHHGGASGAGGPYGGPRARDAPPLLSLASGSPPPASPAPRPLPARPLHYSGAHAQPFAGSSSTSRTHSPNNYA